MNIEKMREDFEAAYIKRLRGGGFESVIEFRRLGDGYANLFTDGAWWGWQASRAAIEVELPDIKAFEGAYDSHKHHEFVPRMMDVDGADEIFGLVRSIEVREAIESLGLKVKP